MSSKPPPSPFASPTRMISLVNWSAIIASLAVSFALLVSVAAWIVTHPHKAAADAAPPPALAVLAPVADRDAPPTPASRPVSAVEVVPAFHHPDRRDVLLNRVPLIEEAPPPLPPPPPKEEPVKEPVVVVEAPAAAPAGETYGTEVLFLNNPQVAADMARRDKKLLFVMHISGNFEESCFT